MDSHNHSDEQQNLMENMEIEEDVILHQVNWVRQCVLYVCKCVVCLCVLRMCLRWGVYCFVVLLNQG